MRWKYFYEIPRQDHDYILYTMFMDIIDLHVIIYISIYDI